MEYSSPFGGETAVSRSEIADVSATMESDGFGGFGSTGSTVAANAERSPIDRRIAASNWSREDVELAIKAAGTIATITALYLTYRGGR